ncbi:[FeFe]-hydrogenase maturation protein HydE, partial [hydrothermal vent metagenome]
MKRIEDILAKKDLTRQDLIFLLQAKGEDRRKLFERSSQVKKEVVGNKAYFRGLVEFSNICSKDCLYCGIRKSNEKVFRYEATDEEILEACDFAYRNRFASVVLQSGELSSPAFTKRVA